MFLSYLARLRVLFLLILISFQVHSMCDEQASYKFTAVGRSLTGERHVKNEDYYTMEDRYLAIFDGHGGHRAAECACSFLYYYIKKRADLSDENIIAAYWEVDTKINGLKKFKHEHDCGTTALSIFIDKDNLVVANVGDSRGILLSNNTYFDLAQEHRPSNNNEVIRINNYIKNWRVDQRQESKSSGLSRSLESSPTVVKKLNFDEPGELLNKPTQLLGTQSLGAEMRLSDPDLGKWTVEKIKDKWEFRTGLSITRSLGHPQLKKYGLSECPFIQRFSLDDTLQLVVLFSDGIGDLISNQEMASLLRAQLEQGHSLEEILNNFIDVLVHKNGCPKFSDDATLIIARLNKCS